MPQFVGDLSLLLPNVLALRTMRTTNSGKATFGGPAGRKCSKRFLSGLYHRAPRGLWQAEVRIGGKRIRQTTDEEALDRAKDVAEEWILAPREQRAGRFAVSVSKERIFGKTTASYLPEV